MRINSNATYLNSLRNILHNSDELKKSAEKLASGLRINRASDDPAGLVISEKMRSQIASIEQELRNIDDTSNKYSAADGTIEGLQNSLRDIRDVALAAANTSGNFKESQRAYQRSADDAIESYNEIQSSSTYGTQNLLDGSEGSVADLKPLEKIDVSSAEAAQQAVETIDKKIDELSKVRGEIGATQKNDLDARRNNLEIELNNLIAAESSIRDVDMAREYSEAVRKEVSLKASMAMLAHQQQVPNLVLSFLNR